MKLLLIVVIIAFPLTGYSAIFKCKGIDGNVSYSSAPCEEGERGQQISIQKELSSSKHGNSRDVSQLEGLCLTTTLLYERAKKLRCIQKRDRLTRTTRCLIGEERETYLNKRKKEMEKSCR